MHSSTKKWLFTKISSLILLPLMIWFIVNFVSIYDENYSEVALFFTQQPSKVIFSIFVIPLGKSDNEIGFTILFFLISKIS